MAMSIADLLVQNSQRPDPVANFDPFSAYLQGQQFRSQMDTRAALRQGLPKNPDGSLNYGGVIDTLARAGNLDAVKSFAGLAEQQADKRFDRQHKTAALDLQRRALEEKPVIKTVKDAAGNEVIVQVSPSGQARRIETGTGGPAPNPYSSGNMTEGQANAALYASRMANAERVLNDPKVADAATSLTQRGMASIPVAGNFMVSEAFQRFDQAQRDFINAVLRRESGAVISDAEFANARKQYFPEPGDTKERLAQKRQNRIQALKGISGAAGPKWTPNFSIDASGNVAEAQAAPQSAPQAAPPQQPQGQPRRVASKQEYDALPSGTQYVAPDGSVRTKR